MLCIHMNICTLKWWIALLENIRPQLAVGETNTITVRKSEAGIGNITFQIKKVTSTTTTTTTTTTIKDVDYTVVDNGDGTVTIRYTPLVEGTYTADIKFGGVTVPHGHFTQQVWFSLLDWTSKFLHLPFCHYDLFTSKYCCLSLLCLCLSICLSLSPCPTNTTMSLTFFFSFPISHSVSSCLFSLFISLILSFTLTVNNIHSWQPGYRYTSWMSNQLDVSRKDLAEPCTLSACR